MSQTQNQNQSRGNLAHVLWKVKDALHKADNEGVCAWHCCKEIGEGCQLGYIC
jgi:hypothetical protein